MKTTFIYTLSDSNGQVRYVGKSNNPKYRFKKHLLESKKIKTYKEKWINSELINNNKIYLDVIDEVNNEEWSFWETYWISQFITWGFNLVNGTSGGEGSNGFKGKTHSDETILKLKSSGFESQKNRKIFHYGTDNVSTKLTDNQVKEIINRKLNGEKNINIAKDFNISPKYVYYLAVGKARLKISQNSKFDS